MSSSNGAALEDQMQQPINSRSTILANYGEIFATWCYSQLLKNFVTTEWKKKAVLNRTSENHF